MMTGFSLVTGGKWLARRLGVRLSSLESMRWLWDE